MITLNLISPNQKQILKIKQFYQILENFLGVLVIYSIILAVVLLPINQSVKHLNEDIINKKNEIDLKNQSITQKLNVLNNQIDILSKIQNEFFDWVGYIINISELVPANVSLNSISTSQKTKDFIIRGYSRNRDALITLKSNLENSPLFSEVNVPLSNFLTQEEITFEITGSIK